MHKHYFQSKHLKKLLFSCVAFLISWNAYSQNLWGANSIQGSAEGEFQNAFINSTTAGSYSPTSWTALTVFDGSGSPGAAYWTRNLLGYSQGAYWGNTTPVASPSQPNGIAIFESDLLDNGGAQGCFGCGTAPSPHKGELISPQIDLTGYTNSYIDVSFYSYYRAFQINELSVSFSTDDGTTWGTATDYRIAQPDLTEGMITIELPNNTLTGISNLTQCRVKFTFDGDYYFALIDDVTISLRCSVADQTVSSTTTTICPNTSASIDLGSSESGVDYYLRDDSNNSIIDGPIDGTGSAISFSTGSLTSTTTYNVYGNKDKGVTLPTTNDHVRFSAPFFSYGNSITVEAWVYSTGGEQPWAGQSGNAVDNMTENVWLWHGGTWFVNNNGSWVSLVFPAMPSGWTHVTTVANASGLEIYYNGVSVASNTTGVTSGIRNNATSIIDLGHDPRFVAGTGGRNSNVGFDNFVIWNYDRTAGDILNDMNTCFDGSETGLVQYSQFNEGTGTVLSSVAGSGGTIMNSSTNWIAGAGDCACSMEMSSTITITVQDNAPTVASAPSNMSVTTNAANCTAVVSYTDPTFDDDCDGSGLSGTMTAGLASGSNFPLGTTTVTFEYTDASSQMISTSFDITVTSDLSVSAAVTSNYNGEDISCNGGSDGEATATVTGGTSPYTYSWTTGGTTATVVGLGAGSTTVTVTDANDCQASAMTTLTEPTALSASGTSTDEISGNDGTINLTVTGGTGTLSYAWTGPNSFTATTEDLSGLEAGTYNVTVTDANGCTTTTQVIVSSTVGINESNVNAFKLYPNPTNGIMTIESTLTGNVNVKVMDAVGKLVMNTIINNAKSTIDLTSLERGVYFIQLNNNDISKTIRVVLEK